jgi:hypothetical protein
MPPLRIALLELHPQDPTATGERGRAILAFLRAHGCAVDVLSPSPEGLRDFERFRFSLWSRLKRRALSRPHLPHLWDHIADELEPALRRGSYDVILARGPAVGHVFTRGFRQRRILDLANVTYLELYHAAGSDPRDIELVYTKEMQVYEAADAILAPHDILARFIQEHVYRHPKVATVRLGCPPPSGRARFSAEPRIVYAGSYEYIQDPFLLSLLSARSPFPIHCYGSRDPNRAFLPRRMDFKGYAPDMGFLADYQFGLITVSADRLRRASPATKFPYYLSAGLPVLFPAWMEEGHTYQGAVPYTEDSFVGTVTAIARDEPAWTRLSGAALQESRDLGWETVLVPLLDLLGPPRQTAG